MADLAETQTLEHLKEAYAREAQANIRYHFPARLADAAARPDVAHVLRAAADDVQDAQVLRAQGCAGAAVERGHALGFLDLLSSDVQEARVPRRPGMAESGHGARVPELVSAMLADNLRASIEAELHEFSTLYTHHADVAAREGFPEIARWFLALAEAGRTHARWLQQCLDGLEKKP